MPYRPGDLTRKLGRKLVSKTVLHEMRKVLVNDPLVHVWGPVPGTPEHEGTIQRLQDFRAAQYRESAAYLNSGEQDELEQRLGLDARSFHFFATSGFEVLGTVRVTRHPFELTELTEELRATSAGFRRYLELSRLVVAPGRRGAGVGKKLCYAAMIWAVTGNYRGFIAICREQRRVEFQRFGLTPFENRTYVIPQRHAGEYRFLWGDWRRITAGTARHYAKKRMAKRVEALFGAPARRAKENVCRK